MRSNEDEGHYSHTSHHTRGSAYTNSRHHPSSTSHSQRSGSRTDAARDEVWVLDGDRHVARHAQRCVQLASTRVWQEGDVLGCLLDCETGTIHFTVNGRYQRAWGGGANDKSACETRTRTDYRRRASEEEEEDEEEAKEDMNASRASVQGADGTHACGDANKEDGCTSATALFRHVRLGEGLCPMIELDARAAVVMRCEGCRMRYCPPGYHPLDAREVLGDVVTAAVLSEHKQQNRMKDEEEENVRTDAGEMQRAMQPHMHVERSVLRQFYRRTEMRLCSLAPYAMTPVRAEAVSAKASLQAMARLHILSATVECIVALAHDAAAFDCRCGAFETSTIAEEEKEGGGCGVCSLRQALQQLRPWCWPFVSMRLLQRTLRAHDAAAAATTEERERLRLTLNRRRALAATAVTRPSSCFRDVLRRMRDRLFGQVYYLLADKPATLFCTGEKLWSVRFVGEGADDVGGPYRETLSCLCRELMHMAGSGGEGGGDSGAGLSLFAPSANRRTGVGARQDSCVIHPHPSLAVSLNMYRFVGRLMGAALRSGEPVSLHLSTVVWKALVGEALVWQEDLPHVDWTTAQALCHLQDRLRRANRLANTSCHDKLAPHTADANAATSISMTTDAETHERGDTQNDEYEEECEYESEQEKEEWEMLCPGGFVARDDAGVAQELVPGGAHMRVHRRNAARYMERLAQLRLCAPQTRPALAQLMQGFYEVVPRSGVHGMPWFVLEELVCGGGDYDPDALLDAAEYAEELTRLTDDRRVGYLREVLRGFTRRERAGFMRFVSGREQLPSHARLRILADDTPVPRHQRMDSNDTLCNDDRLPHASTCFYWLSLPRYSSAAVLRERLLFATEHCIDMDADFRLQQRDLARPNAGGDDEDEEGPTLSRAGEDEGIDYSHLR